MSSIWTMRRSARDVKLTGLCGGLAQHWGVDPLLVRVGCVLLALSGGIGIVLYVAGWLLLPVEGSDHARIEDFLGGQTKSWPKEAWLAIVVVACIVVFSVLGLFTPFGFGPAVILALLWYFGYYKNRSPRRPTAPTAPAPDAGRTDTQLGASTPVPFRYPGPPTDFTRAADAWRQRIEENAVLATSDRVRPSDPPRTTNAPAAEVGTEPSFRAEQVAFWSQPDPVGLYAEPAAPVVVRRADALPARRLRLITLVGVGAALSGLGVAQTMGVAVPVAAYFGAALLVVGLALVAATWCGRARGLLPVGLLLAVAVVASSLVGPIARQHDIGSPHVAYRQLAELPAGGDSQEVGQLTVDLSRLTVTRDVSYAAHVEYGSLQVVAPKGVNVRVEYAMESGVVQSFDTEARSGTDLTGVLDSSRLPGRPTLTLDLSVETGTIRVKQ